MASSARCRGRRSRTADRNFAVFAGGVTSIAGLRLYFSAC